MTIRPIIDTPTELDERAAALTRIVVNGDWSSEFVRHHIRKMIVEAQTAAGTRAAANLSVSMQRPWAAAEPVPGPAPRLLLPAED
jgi:hypothetical protein